MAFNDTLFQLGMDLTRSSTTQTEDLVVTAPRPRTEVRKDHFVERDGVKFAGTHLIVDLIGAKRLGDLRHIEDTLKKCVEVAGATLLHCHVHKLPATGGVRGVAVLEESHVSFHSWPEAGYAAVDLFMCGGADPRRAVDVLQAAFAAQQVDVKEHLRGETMGEQRWRAASAKSAAPRDVSGSSSGRVVRARRVA